MAVCVIGLKQALAPSAESMMKRDKCAVVVRHRVCLDFRNLAESRVWCARWNRAAASSGRERSEAKCVGVRVLYQAMNAVMPEVTDADGSIGAKTLLPFQVPSLILRRVCPLSRVTDSRGKKAWIRCLDLSQSSAGGKAVGKCPRHPGARRCERPQRAAKQS